MLSTSNQSRKNSNHTDFTQQNSKEYVEELLHTWTTHSKSVGADDTTLIGIAAEICSILSKRNSFEALDVFLQRLPDLVEYNKHQDILRARISLALHKKQYEVVQNIIKNNVFVDCEDVIKAWDESHYGQEEERLHKSLTPLARFRVRKRHPPPTTICPSGVRKTASLPKHAIKVLRQWLVENFNDPYPSGDEKIALAKLSGLSPNQVKTWFANARRRIHKGSDTIIADHTISMNGVKSSHNDRKFNTIFLRRNQSIDEAGTTVLPSEMSSQRSVTEENNYERALGSSFHCVHSAHSTSVCLHCQSYYAQSNAHVDDYWFNGPRLSSHANGVTGGLSMYQPSGYLYPRWPYYTPAQHRYEEADAWQRGYGYLPDTHERGIESEGDGATERLAPENSLTPLPLIDQYWQNTSFMQEKAQSMTHVTPSKDELTDYGAARILADLSSKQNWALSCSYPAEALQCQIK